MPLYLAETIDTLRIPLGEKVNLESLRQAVIPPYLMLMPFITVPDGILVEGQQGLDEDGVHGCVYTLNGVAACTGKLTIGFRDMQTNEVTHQKEIDVVVV